MVSRRITISKIVIFIYRLIYLSIINLKTVYFTVKNFNKCKILIFSDSRGFDVEKKQTKFDLFDCYPGLLMKQYNVHCCICPEKHTTIIDFLDRYQGILDKYDFVILHAGIVDFSPRHRGNAKHLIYEKKPLYDKIFTKEKMLNHLNGDLCMEYEGEQTINMFSLQMAEVFLIPHLSNIRNLIWIGCNNFVDGWEGNYPKARPKNIKLVEEYSRLFVKLLPCTIDLSNWSDEEVTKFTCDNIHLTKQGHKELFSKIVNKINAV